MPASIAARDSRALPDLKRSRTARSPQPEGVSLLSSLCPRGCQRLRARAAPPRRCRNRRMHAARQRRDFTSEKRREEERREEAQRCECATHVDVGAQEGQGGRAGHLGAEMRTRKRVISSCVFVFFISPFPLLLMTPFWLVFHPGLPLAHLGCQRSRVSKSACAILIVISNDSPEKAYGLLGPVKFSILVLVFRRYAEALTATATLCACVLRVCVCVPTERVDAVLYRCVSVSRLICIGFTLMDHQSITNSITLINYARDSRLAT